MAAVQAFLATLNDLAQAGSLAGSWLRRGAGSRSATYTESDEPWDEAAYALAGVEPLLEDMLHDPLVGLLMQADRIGPAEVRRALDAKRRELLHRAERGQLESPGDPIEPREPALTHSIIKKNLDVIAIAQRSQQRVLP